MKKKCITQNHLHSYSSTSRKTSIPATPSEPAMNINTACALTLAAVVGVLISLTHGGSEQMIELNAKTSEWLSIGVPIVSVRSSATNHAAN